MLRISSVLAPSRARRSALLWATASALAVVAATAPALAAPPVYWDGDGVGAAGNNAVDGGDGTWTSASTNWTTSSGAANSSFTAGDVGVFSGAPGVVTLSNAATVGGLQFTVDGYQLQGTAITLNGAGTTTISVGDGLGGGASYVATIADRLNGTGGTKLVKTDLGTLVLTTSANTIPGGIEVAAGSLLVNGSTIATGGVQVDAAGTLGGTSTIGAGAGGHITVDGTLAPGGLTAPGTLTTGNLVLNPDAHLRFRLGQAGTAGGSLNDLIIVNNSNLTLDGTVDVTQSAGGTFGAGIYRLINYNMGFVDNGLDVGSLPTGFTATVQTSIADQVNLVVAAAPAGGGGGGGGTPPPPPLTFWNGGGQGGAGTIAGGSGTWLATSSAAWTDAGASASGGFANGQFAIFAGQPGVVTIDNSRGAVTVSGLQFAADGYRLTGGALTLAGDTATIRVGDGTTAGAAFTATIDAALTGAAQLVKTDGGTLVLTGANTYAGGTAIQGGTLVGNAASFGSGGVRDDAALVIDQATDATFANAIDGAGSLTKTGAGRLTYTGTGGLTGATAVAAGALQVDGALAGSAVAVRGGATLAGAGTVGAVSADAGATLAPTRGSALTVNGALTQASGSTFQAIIDPAAGVSNRLVVQGAATIAPGAVLNVTQVGAGALKLGDSFTVLTAAGGVTGTYSLTGDLARVSAFLGLRDAYDANDVFLKVAQVRPLQAAGATPNQVAAATGAQSLPDSNPLKQTLVGLPDDPSAQRAFDQLSGEANATARAVLMAGGAEVRDAALARLQDCGVNPKASGQACADDRPAGWAQVLGGWGRIGGGGSAAGADHSSAGFLTGLDMPVGGWRLGGLAGYSRTTWDVDSSRGSGQSDDYHLGAYAGRGFGGFDLRLGASYSWHDVSGRRAVAFADVAEGLKADYDAATTQAFGELGYRLAVGDASFEPFVGVAQMWLHTGGFSESGGQTALSVQADTLQTTVTTLGVRPAMQLDLGGAKAALRGLVGWRHAFGDVDPQAQESFAGGSAFTVRAAPLARDAAALEAAADFAIGSRGTASLGYGGQFGGRVTDQRVRLDLRLTF